MESILAPVEIEILKSELTPDKFVRHTNNASNMIYCFTYHDSPNLMDEVGRLREVSFRLAGGGTGKSKDIDEYDTCEIHILNLLFGIPKRKKL